MAQTIRAGLRLGWLAAVLVLVSPKAAPAQGPALQLAAASGAPGENLSAEILLTVPPGQAFTALQWEITYPPVQLGLTNRDVVIAGPAKAAGRELVCAPRTVKADSYVYRCVLAGGRQAVSSGAIALVTFQIRPYARPGPITVEIGAAAGVSGDGKLVEIPSSRTDVTIR